MKKLIWYCGTPLLWTSLGLKNAVCNSKLSMLAYLSFEGSSFRPESGLIREVLSHRTYHRKQI
jgi:hypothetical protein